MIQTENLTKVYQMGEDEVRALNGASFTIEKGEMLAIMGPSGSGKSTLLNLIGLLDTPTSGELVLVGNATSALNDDARTRLRAHSVGFVFQFLFFVFPFLR